MSHTSLLVLVVLMGVAIYIPRMMPLVILQNLRLSPFWSRFLQFIPYAALAALVFPGILTSTGSTPSAIAGGVVSVVLAWFRVNLLVVVVSGILGVYAWNWLVG